MAAESVGRAADTGPLIIAHRGCPGLAPENTLTGVRAAVSAGADLVEVDVRLSADGVPMVVHDAHLRRLARRARRVSRLSAEQLGATRVLGSDQTIPTLSEVLGELGSTGIALDIKDPRAVDAILRVLDRAAFSGSVLGWSEHERVIRELVAADRPSLEVALLRAARRPRPVRAFLADAVAWRAQAVSVDERIVDAAFVARAGAVGLGVYTLVNAVSADAVAAVSALGVRGVITDWPGPPAGRAVGVD